MDYETIKYEKQEGYCLITLNRPRDLNALNLKMWPELDDAMARINSDDEIRAFIFTGAPRPDGRPCFCAGADLKEMAGFQANGSMAAYFKATPVSQFWAQRQPRLAAAPAFEKITWSPKVSIAAVDGVCTAGGIELALACDIILVSETAQMSDMHVTNLGWVGGAAASTNMAWRIGVSKALELCLTGDVIDGREAYRLGLANQVFAPHKLMEGAREMAKKIGSRRLGAVTMTKATCMAVQDMDRISSWHYCDAAYTALMNEPDSGEWGPGRWLKQR
ncbi:MAG: enoyl-CoA hydratase/isomerase family protein [Chloroflexi bacterium]|nr:enoyl-CoA hydratase/isomerase family protein [Chloroflexota bacterium]